MQPEGSVLEICHVTSDIDRAIDHWVHVLRAGPFFVFDAPAGPGQINRGRPSNVDMRVAFGFSGGVLIELIQPLNDVPSIFREVLDARGDGHHHLMLRGDYEKDKARLEARGYAVAFSGSLPSGERFALYDTQADNGGFIELLELTPASFGPMELLHQIHLDWDGKTEPKRDFFAFLASMQPAG